MATKIIYLEYTIHLTDKDEVERLQALDEGQGQGPGIIIRAPNGAAIEFAAPIKWQRQGSTPDPFAAPCITSDHLVEIWIGGLVFNGYRYPPDVATFTKTSGGFLGIGGTTTRYYWRGSFVYSPPLGVSEVTGEALVAMPQRRWIDGFEMPTQGESGSGSGSPTNYIARAAARHAGGYGLAIRHTSGGKVHTPTEGGGAATGELWQRFYIRVRKNPTLSACFWKLIGTPSTTVGMELHLTATGELAVNATATSTLTLLGTAGALEQNRWYKLDVCAKYGVTGFFRLFIDGVSKFAMDATAMPSGQGMNAANTITQSTLGCTTANHAGSWDLDDWIGADLAIPGTAPNVIPSVDWLHGSKIVKLSAQGFGVSNGSWAGPGGAAATDWRHTAYRPVGSSVLTHQLVSSGASERLVLVMDTERHLDAAQCLGVASMIVGLYNAQAHATADGKLGWLLPDGSAEDLAVIDQNAAVAWYARGYFPSGLLQPLQWPAGLEIVFEANATAASSKTVYALGAVVELIGDWHPEDHVVLTTDPEGVEWGVPHFEGIVHNAPYHNSVWAKPGPSPANPVIIHTGTYTGNDKSTQLAFRAPVHWLWIRRTSGTPNGGQWFSSSLAGWVDTYYRVRPELCTQVMIDPNFLPAGVGENDQTMQTVVQITGNDAALNANGVLYNYIAFCDPGMRFCEATVLWQPASGEQITEKATTWVPEAGIVHQAQIGGTATVGMFWKGPGTATDEMFRIAGAASIASALSFEADGTLKTPSGSGIYLAGSQLETAVFRRDDGSGDPGVNCVVQLATYTGNGSASRTVALSPASLRRPMWALVCGSNGVSKVRDGSHAGSNSLTLPATNDASTGITGGGVDSIDVGSALNTNGVVFDVLVFPGCDASTGAGTNGWGVNCENIPVDPASYDPDADPDPWDPEPDEPAEPEEPEEPVDDEDPGPEGTGGPGPTPRSPYPDFDFAEDCVEWTQGVMNIALSRLGISKQIVDITTDATAEAVACRLHYSEDASATLRDFPWAFATRYSQLALMMGDADGQDTVQSWLATVWYEEGEVVRVSDVDYYCIDAHVNHTPPNAAYWSTEAPEEVNGDWLYCYRAPARMMFARRLVNPNKVRRDWDLDPPRFRAAADDRGFTIYTNEMNPELEYTIRPVCVAAVDDAIFRSALAWRHAHSIAAALSRDQEKIAYCWEMYQVVLGQARRWAASEVQQSPAGDPDWIAGRD